MRIGVYPGTFDPVTNGHLDIITRAAKLFDKLYVVIPINVNKHTMFSVDERLEMIKEATTDLTNIELDKTDLLTVEYAKNVNATAILRGLRMVSDFEYELQMAALNKSLDKEIDTIFIMASHEYSFLSSSSVKEIAEFGGDFSSFVPENVAKKINEKIKK